jgi:hypothetical protein
LPAFGQRGKNVFFGSFPIAGQAKIYDKEDLDFAALSFFLAFILSSQFFRSKGRAKFQEVFILSHVYLACLQKKSLSRDLHRPA